MGIAGELATKPRKLTNSSDWKAAEYKQFTLSYCLVLFDGYLEQEYMNGLQKFVEVVEISSAPTILRSDIGRLRRSAIDFVDHYETHWFRFRPERVSFCKSIIHAILHLADCTERFGPLCRVSQYWLEREIGWHMSKLNARTRPAESMFRSVCFPKRIKFYSTD
ncbi:unnamed protein product [Chondrus crispus]|uniref:Uncharacterized protein n=1 Tax=Chondrus crispus TaxID=2769 RepID=R7Q2U9_CHOCR|nr:unnamed protein product [Chondrus crispus]CDF32892.1 unnamed protein product [Chondrus crispus]|eukprot:XP_005712693.1 unnamed protein product [Chondrus crispus]